MLPRRLVDKLDYATLLGAVALSGLGVLAIASATLGQPARSGIWHTQLLWLGIALLVALVVVAVDYHHWAEFSLALHAVVLVLLVLVIFFGKEVGGNRSWLVVGPFTLQPSEFSKWTTCLVLATYLSERVRAGVGIRQIVEMGVLAGLPMLLIAMQPDMGTALTYVPIYLAAPVGWGHLKAYQKARILTVFQPDRDPAGVGYQVRQSKIAIGSGKFAGKGLFHGTQSHLNFLPAQHTDFVLSVLAEEFGFMGATIVLALFYYVLHRGILAARSAQDRLGTYLCLLVVAWIVGQVGVNVGMVLGLLPTIGVPLPFLSYGGSALLAALAGIGLIANVRGRRIVN